MQPQADPFIAPPCYEQISILYQDEYLLLINKPSALLSLSGKHPLNKDSVHFRLVQDFPSATLVHRLDFGTSGIMVVALNKEINAHIGKQFQARTVTKTYTALLHGHITDNATANKNSQQKNIIDLPIAKDPSNFPLQKICHKTGRSAISQYRVIEHLESLASRVIFTPITGRTHQLRIHSREIGHPILGCDLYATDIAFNMAERLMLHATTLSFDHPISGQRIDGHCPCPF